jgi:FAD/FMN-containing dehydrogenase
MDGDSFQRTASRVAAPPAVDVAIGGWGRHPVATTALRSAGTPRDVLAALAADATLIARGAGRSYGDASIGAGATIDMRGLDRLIAFDPATGRLKAEAGLLLKDLIEIFLPRGFFPPVVPGTQFVTLGGALAADVHGKNHHGFGGFSRAVSAFTLATARDGVIEVTRGTAPELFAATVGGMGLTGVILDVTLDLRPVESGWLWQTTLPTADLAATMKALAGSEGSTYSVAWIDCVARGKAMGRSLVYLGEHATAAEVAAAKPGAPLFPAPKARRLRAPVDAPGIALNRLSVGAFNSLYYWKGSQGAGERFLAPWESYFFPLDGVLEWNRIYGRRGFVQHQSVLPAATAKGALARILELVTRKGEASFLAVLKTLGASDGLISFPSPGFTLTLDFPVRRGLADFLAGLDAIVAGAGGRLYLAKDACQSRETFDAGYPAADRFRALRRELGAAPRLRSLQSERLGL